MKALIQKIRTFNARAMSLTQSQLADALNMFLFVIISINAIAAILAVLIYYYIR